MIKARYNHKDVVAAIFAAQAWRQAINVTKYWEVKDKEKLIGFYKQSMRGWALHAMLLQRITPKE